MSNHGLLQYWPRYEDIVACVKTEAEASSEAVSLAVHQPMRFERSLMGSAGVIDRCDEHELLQAFLTEHLPEGRVIVPIVGYTGIGKSHVVRWLHAQICRRPGADRRVVIRIPKGMSLKGVLGMLLELKELQGSPYEQFRRELVRAQQELDPREAAGLLCEMLAYTLEEMGTAARTRLNSNPKDKGAQDQEAYCRGDFLPSLLRNQLLRDKHFVQTPDGKAGVVKRLVEQLTEERPAGTDDDRKHDFVPSDLIFDDRIDRGDLGRAEARTLSQLDREDRRVVAAQILNSALDDAKQRLLRLDPTVSDLFDAVRRQLLAEGKELILLFEDFAVLSGLQKQILQVIIKEAIRDGRQVLCTMRTALAYTKGYMQETVLSRANTIYEIPDEPGTAEEILDRIERLVGAYLNAARLGQAKLENAYLQKAAESVDLRSWIPRFEANVEAEACATLDAFGKSEDGYELFPFNHAAIEQLAREGSIKDGQLVYNPRSIINNVINKVLWFREQFEQGGFPPAKFGGTVRPLPAGVTADAGRRVAPGDLDRYLRFLTYWGGFPNTPAEVAFVEPRVFEAFGFDPTLLRGKVEPHFPKPNVTKVAPPQEGRKPISPVSAVEAKWEETLERWRGGTTIPQADANQLRKWIAEALKGFIEWDWDLFRPRREATFDSRDFFPQIYIPRASGNAGRSAEDSMTTLCVDEDLSDEARSADVYFAIMSVVRFHGVYNGSWDYDKAEEDLPRYAAFLETLSTRARTFLRRRYFKDDWDPIPALVQGLLVGARALAIEGAASDSDLAALINALFVPTPEDGTTAVGGRTVEADGTNWPQFTETLRSCRSTGDKESRHQLSWAGHLLNLVGARQGQADTVHAVDISRLKQAVEKTVSNWEFTEVLPNPLGIPDFGPFRTTYNELKRFSSAITKSQQFLIRWRSQVLVWLGEGLDKEKKEALVGELKGSIEAARARGLMRGVDSRPLLRLIANFQNAPVIAALQDVEKLNEKTPRGTVLTVLGRGYEPVALLCANLQQHLEEFFQSAEAELQSESLRYGESPLIEATEALAAELEKTGHLLKELKEE